MARPIRFALLAGVALACGGVAVLLVQTRQLRQMQEQIMAQFDGLDADINELKQAVADAATRVEAAVDRLLDDTADNAEIAEARTEVRASIDALKNIAPVEEPAPPAEPEPGTEEPVR